MLRTASLQIFLITAPWNDVCRHVPHFCSRCCLTERSYFLCSRFLPSPLPHKSINIHFLYSRCFPSSVPRKSIPNFCSRRLPSLLLPRKAFLLSRFQIFDLTAASQSIPIVYVPDFCPHCCLAEHSYCLCSDFCPHCSLTDRSYFLCSRFLTSLLPRRAFLLSMFPIFALTAPSQTVPIFYVPDF